MVEVAISLACLSFCVFCVFCVKVLNDYNRRADQEMKRELSQDYTAQWQEFEAHAQDKFEDDYWKTVVNKPEVFQHGG